jgi:MFS family permease
MDASSELVHSLLPAYMVTTLGASVTSVGLIEGVAEATAMIVKVFSGTLSDLLGRRKLLTVVGYGLAAVTKPLFPLSDSMGLVLAARFIDRIGKGIRGAPRDALIGEIAPADLRGACFGLRQSLDTIGAFIGPSLAMIFMLAMADNVRAVLWIAVAPAFLAVAVVVFGVHEPASSRPADHARIPIRARSATGPRAGRRSHRPGLCPAPPSTGRAPPRTRPALRRPGLLVVRRRLSVVRRPFIRCPFSVGRPSTPGRERSGAASGTGLPPGRADLRTGVGGWVVARDQ